VPPPAPAPAIGEAVCAVGNQFGLGPSVICGVVSALGRSGTGFNPIEDFVQTDAVVNPGSSGGALVDAEGRLVGLLSAIFSKGGDANIGVNFATSTALVRRVVEDLRAYGRVKRGKSGLRVVDLGDDERAEAAGARVIHVARGGAADAAGLAPGDLIVAVDGRPVRRASAVSSAVYLRRIGDPLAVTVLRQGRRLDATLVLAP
jgi:S1-C subfamily serine protease